MKKFRYLIFAILLISSLKNIAEEKPLNVNLTSAKVYLGGCELTHNGSIKLKEGYNDLILTGFAFNLDPNSIAVKITGSGSVQSVNNDVKDHFTGIKPIEIENLEDSLKSIQYEVNLLNNILSTLDIELDFINKNNTINKKESIINPNDLSSMADFIYNRTLENKNYRLKINKELDIYRLQQNKINQKIAELNAEYQKTYKRDQLISVSIYSPKAEEVKLEINYYTPSAAWTPFYEARIDEINKPYNLILKANIWQATGIDWNNIPITISSKMPSFNTSIPVLGSNALAFIDTYRKTSKLDYIQSNTAVASSGSGWKSLSSDDASEGDSPAISYEDSFSKSKPMKEISAAQYASFEFTSNNNYTILSTGKKQLIEIDSYQQEAIYDYYTAPKLNQAAFLLAKSPNKFAMEMLSGEVNVYFEKSFIGKSYLDFNTISDTIQLSLGIDKGVSVKREIISDFTESKFFSSDIERSFGFKMTFRNNKKQKVKIKLEDVIPVSSDDKIEINTIEISGGSMNKTTGIVNWILELEPGKSVEKIIKFSVKHPKNRRVSSF